MKTEKYIIDAAIGSAADLAGIEGTEALQSSLAHVIYPQILDYTSFGPRAGADGLGGDQLFNWPDRAESAVGVKLIPLRGKPRPLTSKSFSREASFFAKIRSLSKRVRMALFFI